MRVRALVVPVTAIALLAGACRAQSPATAMDADAWRRDLRFLVEQITTRHPDAFHRVPRAEFDREVAALDGRIATLGADEIKVGLLHVAAQIGDGHTRLSLGVSAPHYPYQIEWLDGALRVTRAGRSAAPALGGRVVAFDDVPADTVWARVRTLVPLGETEGLVRSLGGELLAVAPVLHGLHVARSPEGVTLRVAFDDGQTRRVGVGVTPPGAGVDWVDAGAPPPLSRTPAMRRPAFAWAVVPGTETGYVAWNNYLLAAPREDFRDSVRAMFAAMDAAKVKRIVFDLRWNRGGDFTRGRQYLLAELKTRERFLRPGGLYVLIGRQTFSAAMVNTVDLVRAAGAILVGEPTGARPNSYSEAGFFRLPASGFEGTVAICRYDLWPQDVPGVPPDHAAPPTWSDFKSGRDSALSWILSQPLPSTAAPPVKRDVKLTPPCSRSR